MQSIIRTIVPTDEYQERVCERLCRPRASLQFQQLISREHET